MIPLQTILSILPPESIAQSTFGHQILLAKALTQTDMDDSYGNYAIGSYPRSSAAHYLHTGESGGKAANNNRYRRGIRAFADGRENHQTRTWRGAGIARPSTSPGRDRASSLQIRERLSGGSPTRATRADTKLGSSRSTNSSERRPSTAGGALAREKNSYADDGYFANLLQECRAYSGISRSGGERGGSLYKGDRPRWAVAEAPVAIGGMSKSVVCGHDEQGPLDDHWIKDHILTESSQRIESTASHKCTKRGGLGMSSSRADGSSALHQDRSYLLDNSVSLKRYGGEDDVVGASSSYASTAKQTQDMRDAASLFHEEAPQGLAALSLRREWIELAGASGREIFARDSFPEIISADSATPNENTGISSRDLRGGKLDYHALGHGHLKDIRDVSPDAPRHCEEANTARALWKAKKSQVPQLVQDLEDKLTRGTVECMICYDMVSRGSPVWSCASCYAIFHLSCIRKWARAPTSADLSISSSNDSLNGNWRCPGCQTVEFIGAKDLRYYCFCGQVDGPIVNPYITPHSCGGSCKKSLDKSKTKRCNHYCTMQCHPGPCPPCAANAPSKSCPCGKKAFTQRCGEQKAVASCGDVCGRQLLCGRHSCSRICHEDPCDSCSIEVRTQCFCGDKQEILSCGRVEIQGELNFDKGLFSCARPCSKPLSCRNHKCQEKCHPGKCEECQLAPSKLQTCPCGKKTLQELVGTGRSRKTCVDDIPTCSQGCGKLLQCGVHVCRDPCHAGPCPHCKVPVDQKCRCGSTTRSVACYAEQGTELAGEEILGLFLCEKKCGQKKRCGRHRCNNKCCPADNDGNHRQQDERDRDPHGCMLACGKKLRCKQHFCQDLCHAGHCPPCLESSLTELSCACGKTSILPPVACGIPVPSCQKPCSFSQACGHAPTHLCHFGDCPPCIVPVSKECAGNHVVLRGVPCGSREIKCNNICGKTRQCGLHTCGRTCHAGSCERASEQTQGNVLKSEILSLSCGQQCGVPRRDCPHTCISPCHPASACPDHRCKVEVTISCGCGRISGEVPCDAGGSGHSLAENEMILKRLPAPLQPIHGNDWTSLGQRKLLCDTDCGQLEKRQLLADAFGVNFQEGGIGGDKGALESDLLAEILRRDPQWVLSVEERFKTLLLGPRGRTSGMKVHVFCAMVGEKRDIIQLLAERWLLSVCTAGREPRRFLVVHVTKKSKVPYLKLLSKTQLPTLGQQTPPQLNSALDMDPALVVAFLEVPKEVETGRLVLRFAGECELVWLNDKNSLAIFGDAARAATALRRVDHASAYKGAISLPGSTAHASGRSGANGPSTVSKPIAKKKALQQESESWVEDACCKESKKSSGPSQKKGQSPAVTTKNLWSPLQHCTRARGTEDGIKGCFVACQRSLKESESDSQCEKTQDTKPPTKERHSHARTSKEASLPCIVGTSASGASNGPRASADNKEDDNWERIA